MRDVIEDHPDSTLADESGAGHIRESLDGQFVCPFCGVVNSASEGPCPRCSMENTAAARKATRERIGPWFVYQHRNPAAPGMKFSTLLTFVAKGKIKPRSIVRGPTTSQLWRFAAHVKGLSREFGVCYSCGGAIEPATNICPHCKRLQEPPPNPDVLLEVPSAAEAPRRNPSPAATSPVRPTPAVKPATGPFSGSAETQLPSMDDLLTDDDAPAAPPRPVSTPQSAPAKILHTQPVASFRKQTQADNFLSARELATAFNLGFNASSPPPPKTRSRRKKARWGRRLFLLILAGGVAAGAYAWMNPPMHQRLVAWSTATWKKVQPLLPAKGGGSSASPTSTSDQKQTPSNAARPPLTKNATAGTESVKVEAAVPTPPNSSRQQPATRSSVAGGGSTRPSSPTTSPAPSNPASQSPPIVAHEKPETDKPPTTEQGSATIATADEAERAHELYLKGLDAEQKVDFVTAAKCYEQIMKLPKDAWPTDVEIRLRLAHLQTGPQ